MCLLYIVAKWWCCVQIWKARPCLSTFLLSTLGNLPDQFSWDLVRYMHTELQAAGGLKHVLTVNRGKMMMLRANLESTSMSVYLPLINTGQSTRSIFLRLSTSDAYWTSSCFHFRLVWFNFERSLCTWTEVNICSLTNLDKIYTWRVYCTCGIVCKFHLLNFTFQPTCIPDSHLYRVTNTRRRIFIVFSPDDGHIVARNM